MVKDDSIEAIYCATDAPAHAKHAMLCMKHGKHVATAVPAFRGDIEDAEKLLECCKTNKGLVYAMFETSVFHDDLYAMEKLYLRRRVRADCLFRGGVLPSPFAGCARGWIPTRTGGRRAVRCGTRRMRRLTTSA